jgi:RimJ/RimL family protein N-acetyltransferase
VNAGTDPQITPELTDGTILLRLMRAEDATVHRAGEDEEMARWVSGGRSTLASVNAFIENSRESWRAGGPRRALGIFDRATEQLIGFIEVDLASLVAPGQVNVSYGVFPEWRGRGIAEMAIELMSEYLRTSTDARQMVLRIAPANAASLRVAEKAGFTFCGLFEEPEGRLARYIRYVKP